MDLPNIPTLELRPLQLKNKSSAIIRFKNYGPKNGPRRICAILMKWWQKKNIANKVLQIFTGLLWPLLPRLGKNQTSVSSKICPTDECLAHTKDVFDSSPYVR